MLLLDYQNVLIESILKDRLAPEYVPHDRPPTFFHRFIDTSSARLFKQSIK